MEIRDYRSIRGSALFGNFQADPDQCCLCDKTALYKWNRFGYCKDHLEVGKKKVSRHTHRRLIRSILMLDASRFKADIARNKRSISQRHRRRGE